MQIKNEDLTYFKQAITAYFCISGQYLGAHCSLASIAQFLGHERFMSVNSIMRKLFESESEQSQG